MRLGGLSRVLQSASGQAGTRACVFEHVTRTVSPDVGRRTLEQEGVFGREAELGWRGNRGHGDPPGHQAGVCGTVIPSITHMFPKRAQRESQGGGAGQAGLRESPDLAVFPSLPLSVPVQFLCYLVSKSGFFFFLRPPPGSLFGFTTQCRTGERVKTLELDRAMSCPFPVLTWGR